MKRLILFLFVTLCAATYLQSQRLERLPPASEVDKDYRSEYRKAKREVGLRIERNISLGYDIVLGELEQVPTAVQEFTATAQTNWGEQLLLPGDIRQRVKAECTHRVVVKVTDTGGKLSHPDLTFGQLPGATYTGEPDPEDGNGHSLHVTGIIAGRGLGLAWEVVEKGLLKFKPIKVLSNAGGGSFSWVANAYATERKEDEAYVKAGTAVIYSGSFGGGTAIIDPVEKELQASIDKGVFFVFANGNSGGAVNYPASSPLAISVASLDQSMAVSSYSSRGPQTDNAMPGRNINSTYKGNGYATLSGTSMATPFLTAAAAIALSKWGIARIPTQAALKAYLAKVATDIPPPGRDDPSGWGVVFIRAILDTEPTGTPPPPPPPPPADPPGQVQAATTITDGYVIRYRFAGDQSDRVLQIKSITMFTDAATHEQSIDNAREYCRAFFPSHQIVDIPKADGLAGAGYWAGQFFEYWGKNNGKPLQVETLTAVDEHGRAFIVTGFDRAEVPEAYDTARPKFNRISN